MPQAFTKILSLTLLSIFLFLGGACVASAQVTSNQSATTTQSQATMQNATSEGDRIMKLKDLACNPFPSGWFNSKDGTFAGCISQGVYYVFYIPLSWVMIAGAFVFDAMLTLSIDTKFIDQEFISKTWTIVRDFSNMLFIFILIYTGVQTILGMGKWAKTVLWVVVMALLINFSLFFTKVVIDAGNILAVGVYQAIAPVKTGLDKNLTDRPGGVPERNVSFVIARGFQPQSFIGKTANVQPLDAAIIFIVAGVVSAFAGYIFFKAAILFSRRLVVFWGLMILSPFAFISMALPGKANKFESWLDALIAQTFVAPVFLFFIYIIMQVVNSGVLSNLMSPRSDGSFTMFTFDKVLMPVIIASLIIKALQESLNFAEDFAGKAGGEFSGMVGSALGFAGSAALAGATGGTSLLARQTVGRLATSKLAEGTLKEGTWQHSLATSASKASYDVRNVGGFAGKQIQTGLGAFGINTKKGVGAVGIKDGKGGYVAHAQRKEDTDMAGAEKAELKDDEKKVINAKYDVENKEAEAKKQEQQVVERAEIVAVAEKTKEDAEAAAKNSTAGQALAGAQTQLDTQTKAAQKATTDREAAQKAIATALDPAGAQKALDDAILKESQALDAVKNAQTAVDNVKTTYSAELQNEQKAIEDAGKALDSAMKDLGDAQKNAHASASEAKIARTAATKEIANENERRRVEYAQGTHDILSSPEARQARVDKIRKGRTESERAAAQKRASSATEEAKKKESDAKFYKELAKKMKELEENH